jgi:hypothetical protein
MTNKTKKSFDFEGRQFVIEPPANITFKNGFYERVYRDLFAKLRDGECKPHIDCDDFTYQNAGFDYYQLGLNEGVALKKTSEKTSNNSREQAQIVIQDFCSNYPLFVTFINNCRFKSDIAIKHAEQLIDEECSISNFIRLKRIIGFFNNLNWTREMDKSESQASSSNLGTISESLLETAFEALDNGKDFFKVNNSQVNSYGDFVLICLPNNLWLSVKSNFARERLLASGYSNDILAVGFFQDYTEFTSQVKIRNMQRAGFLCIYLPDEPVTQDQQDSGTSTYKQTIDFYKTASNPLPLNINGTLFFRPLSSISDDLGKLLKEGRIGHRLSVNF